MANYNIDLVVSAAPHIKDKINTTAIMRECYNLSLIPALIGSIFIFGARVLLVVIVSMISSVLAEVVGNLIFKKKPSLNDLSASVTGLLLAMTLPPSSPWWMVVVGAFSGILIGKAIFGGIGSNPFNPALVGRAVLMVSWPTQMTTWIVPRTITGITTSATQLNAVTSATPLAIVKFQGYEQLVAQFGSKLNFI